MGKIINDIIDEINVKPNKTKLILKWVISVAITLIGFAFVFGQFKSSFFNRMDDFETAINKNTSTIIEMGNNINNGFNVVDKKINKIYVDGFEAFDEYEEFNKKQLILVLDYSQTNKDLLKRMLELNSIEKTKNVENKLNQAKNEQVTNIIPSIDVRKAEQNNNYISLIGMIELETQDTIFYLIGATKKFINRIDKNKYSVGVMFENSKHQGLYDVNYRNK